MITMAIKNSFTINTSADRVWQVIAKEFLDISKWARDVNASYDSFSKTTIPEGAPAAGRFCEVSGFGKVDELIIHFDDKNKELTWTASADKMPGFVTNLQNAWTIKEIDSNKSLVTSQLSADLSGILGTIMYPLMKMNFSKLVKGFIEDFTIYSETGNISETKKKQLDKLNDTSAAIPH